MLIVQIPMMVLLSNRMMEMEIGDSFYIRYSMEYDQKFIVIKKDETHYLALAYGDSTWPRKIHKLDTCPTNYTRFKMFLRKYILCKIGIHDWIMKDHVKFTRPRTCKRCKKSEKLISL